MDAETRKKQLTASLQKANALFALTRSSEYQNHFLPYLKELSIVPFIDPTGKSREQYLAELDKANIEAGVFKRLLSFLSRQEDMVKQIRRELDKPKVSYAIQT